MTIHLAVEESKRFSFTNYQLVLYIAQYSIYTVYEENSPIHLYHAHPYLDHPHFGRILQANQTQQLHSCKDNTTICINHDYEEVD